MKFKIIWINNYSSPCDFYAQIYKHAKKTQDFQQWVDFIMLRTLYIELYNFVHVFLYHMTWATKIIRDKINF